MAKTVCTVSRRQFIQAAKGVKVALDGNGMGAASPREFSTGSFGWYANGRAQLYVGDTAVEVMVGLTLTVVGSKEARPD